MPFEGLRKRLWQQLKDEIAQNVPEERALCEFDCRKEQCTEGEWATCDRRIHRAAGELFPAPIEKARAQDEPKPEAAEAPPSSEERAG